MKVYVYLMEGEDWEEFDFTHDEFKFKEDKESCEGEGLKFSYIETDLSADVIQTIDALNSELVEDILREFLNMGFMLGQACKDNDS